MMRIPVDADNECIIDTLNDIIDKLNKLEKAIENIEKQLVYV